MIGSVGKNRAGKWTDNYIKVDAKSCICLHCELKLKISSYGRHFGNAHGALEKKKEEENSSRPVANIIEENKENELEIFLDILVDEINYRKIRNAETLKYISEECKVRYSELFRLIHDEFVSKLDAVVLLKSRKSKDKYVFFDFAFFNARLRDGNQSKASLEFREFMKLERKGKINYFISNTEDGSTGFSKYRDAYLNICDGAAKYMDQMTLAKERAEQEIENEEWLQNFCKDYDSWDMRKKVDNFGRTRENISDLKHLFPENEKLAAYETDLLETKQRANGLGMVPRSSEEVFLDEYEELSDEVKIKKCRVVLDYMDSIRRGNSSRGGSSLLDGEIRDTERKITEVRFSIKEMKEKRRLLTDRDAEENRELGKKIIEMKTHQALLESKMAGFQRDKFASFVRIEAELKYLIQKQKDAIFDRVAQKILAGNQNKELDAAKEMRAIMAATITDD